MRDYQGPYLENLSVRAKAAIKMLTDDINQEYKTAFTIHPPLDFISKYYPRVLFYRMRGIGQSTIIEIENKMNDLGYCLRHSKKLDENDSEYLISYKI